MRKYKGFTLAEVMIVLTVIGVLTAILLPVARQSMPDENLMKFKKAHNTLGTVVRELVTSDKYYLDGDLGVRPDNNLVDSPTYLCETIADILNTKEVNCSDVDTAGIASGFEDAQNTDTIKSALDVYCRYSATTVGEEIRTNDFCLYQTNPAMHFAYKDEPNGLRLFGNVHNDTNGFDRIYKILCIDIDGIPENATETDCVNECPFGYGIRADGKILTGARADEWLARDINEE